MSTVIPRPIGWVSSVGVDGTLNLAPFSFFNGVSGAPPVVMFSVGPRRGSTKDTLRNVQETGEFVVNIVSQDLAEAMNQTSGEWDYGVDEFELAGLTPAPSVDVGPPRVAEALAAMEAKVSQLVPVEGTSSTMVLGQVVRFHLRQDMLRPNGLVDPVQLQPVGRLGGTEYSKLGEVFEMVRPRVG
ncbi:MAG: flavin reductase family protein [Anaerolineae bacterium]